METNWLNNKKDLKLKIKTKNLRVLVQKEGILQFSLIEIRNRHQNIKKSKYREYTPEERKNNIEEEIKRKNGIS